MNQTLRPTTSKEVILKKGREAIIKSIDYGKIKDPHQDPFTHLWIENTRQQSERKGQKAMIMKKASKTE